MVKGSGVGLSAKTMRADLDVWCDSHIRINSDASAASGIASRVGFGKNRHIEVIQLWLQEKVVEKIVDII